jgi:hypothetical protein
LPDKVLPSFRIAHCLTNSQFWNDAKSFLSHDKPAKQAFCAHYSHISEGDLADLAKELQIFPHVFQLFTSGFSALPFF